MAILVWLRPPLYNSISYCLLPLCLCCNAFLDTKSFHPQASSVFQSSFFRWSTKNKCTCFSILWMHTFLEATLVNYILHFPALLSSITLVAPTDSSGFRSHVTFPEETFPQAWDDVLSPVHASTALWTLLQCSVCQQLYNDMLNVCISHKTNSLLRFKVLFISVFQAPCLFIPFKTCVDNLFSTKHYACEQDGLSPSPHKIYNLVEYFTLFSQLL